MRSFNSIHIHRNFLIGDRRYIINLNRSIVFNSINHFNSHSLGTIDTFLMHSIVINISIRTKRINFIIVFNRFIKGHKLLQISFESSKILQFKLFEINFEISSRTNENDILISPGLLENPRIGTYKTEDNRNRI